MADVGLLALAKEYANKLFGLIRTYPIETGKSGIWTYRKFSDGTVECWGEYIASGVNAALNNYSGYYYSAGINIDLPVKFTSITDFQVNGGSMDRINFARDFGGSVWEGNNHVTFLIAGHQADATSVNIRVFLSVKGTWK